MKTTEILAILVLALGLAAVSLAVEDTWTTKADMPTARSYLSASVVDGKIYAIGGLSEQSRALPTVEMYEPVTNTWVRKADMPTARLNFATSVVSGRIYAIGGLPGTVGAAYSKVEEYDPVTDTWTQKADMPTARNGFGAGVVDGRIYTIGGHTIEPAGATAGLSTVEVYDHLTDTWTRKAGMPTARTGLSVSVVDEKIYAIGGVFTSPWAGLPTVEVYDPATDTWTRKADMITGRSSVSTIVVDKKIYAIGGAGKNPWPGLPAVEIYDPATDNWAQKANMPTGRLALATSAVDGKIYAIGGCAFLRPFLPVFSTVEEYDTGLGVPSPDFNGDEIVDIEDLLILIEHWGQDEPSLDIAPPPFGDGIVDVQDLEVLMSYWQQEILPVELVAYWKLDETEGFIAHDSAGANDGTVMGSPTWQPDAGMIAGALQFDGVDDFVVTNPVAHLGEGPFSVLAWVKGGAPGQVIISQTAGANWLLADKSAGKLMTSLTRPPGGRDTPPPLVSGFVITDGDWHRVGLVWDGANRVLYVDDTEVAKDTQNSLASSSGGLYFGAGKGLEPGGFWSGLIDDVRIYERAIRP